MPEPPPPPISPGRRTPEPEPAEPLTPADRTRRRGASPQRWFRWAHSYTSMISLVIILFFGATGITLNHPTWTLAGHADSTKATGTLPSGSTRTAPSTS